MLNPTTTLSASARQMITQMKQTHEGVTISPNGQYVTYTEQASDGSYTVTVVSSTTGKQISSATDLYPVQYIGWLGNQEVFVGEQIQPGQLELNTFLVSTGQQADVTAASVPTFSELSSDAHIVKVTYSSVTNDIFVLVNSSESSAIYHIGTMEDVQGVDYGGGYVKSIALSQTGDDLYVEENLNGAWDIVRLQQESETSSYSPTYDVTQQVVETNAALIAVNGNTLYFGKVDQNGLVTSVYKQNTSGATTLIKTLATPTLASDIVVGASGSISLNPLVTTSATID